MHSTSRTFPVVLAVLIGGSLCTPSAEARPELGPDTRDFDQVSLALEVDLDLERGALAGKATLVVRSLVPALSLVRLHAVELKVETVETGGVACPYEAADGLLEISLPTPLARGAETTLTIAYQATPRRGLYFFRPSEAHPSIPYQVWSQGEGTDNRHWFPCYDLPDDRLRTSLVVTAPARFQTLSNGRLVESVDLEGGRRRHRWVQDEEHVTYLVTLVVGEFESVEADADGVRLNYLVPNGWGEWAPLVFGRTPAMMEFFESVTGASYPWPSYAQVTVWDFIYGGMENTGATTLNMRALYKEGVPPDYSADGLIAHELAHQWFGDLVTCRTFEHIWLNEGFATYYTDLWFEQAEGRDSFLVRRLESRREYQGAVQPAAASTRARPQDPGGCGDVRDHAYVKGSSVLHMLRALIGDELYQAGIKEYVRACTQASVESDALRAAFERASGTDLSWFFDQWVHGSGYPQVRVRSHHDATAGELVVEMAQTQPVTADMPLFRLPIDIAWMTSDGERVTRRLDFHRAFQRWRIPCASAPLYVIADPEGTLIAEIDQALDRATWESVLGRDASVVARILAVEALAREGEAATAALAAAAATDRRFEVRRAAARALADVPGDGATAALLTAARDNDSRVRSAAAIALGKRPAASVAETLIDLLAHDTSNYLQSEPALALAIAKVPGAADLLKAALGQESHRDILRQRAIEGLKALGDPAVVTEIQPFLDYRFGRGSQHWLRLAALDAVAALAPKESSVRQAIVSLCADPYFRVAAKAATICGEQGYAEASPILARLAQSDPMPGVGPAAAQALERLAPAPAAPSVEGAASAATAAPATAPLETSEAAATAAAPVAEDLQALRAELLDAINALRAELVATLARQPATEESAAEPVEAGAGAGR